MEKQQAVQEEPKTEATANFSWTELHEYIDEALEVDQNAQDMGFFDMPEFRQGICLSASISFALSILIVLIDYLSGHKLDLCGGPFVFSILCFAFGVFVGSLGAGVLRLRREKSATHLDDFDRVASVLNDGSDHLGQSSKVGLMPTNAAKLVLRYTVFAKPIRF